MSVLLYLDYNCFQRGFDDTRQVRIRMETEACDSLFAEAESGKVELVWSFMHQDENNQCPFPERQDEIVRLAAICRVRVEPAEAIRELAKEIQRKAGLSPKDAIHVAVAIHVKAEVFVTCDDEIVAKASRLPVALRVVNPVQYVLKRGML
jgi:predicted nucleic acid-binding protein